MPNEQDITDGMLIRQAQGGDAQAFGALYERYAPAVFRFIYAHLDNRLDAEDLTEDVFMRVWRSLPKYREQGVPFLAYLFRIARNALVDTYRRLGHVEAELSVEMQSFSTLDAEPGEIVRAKMENQRLRQALTNLRSDYREVLTLRFLGELSPEETAKAMKRSPGAVRVLQHRALAALRKTLEGS
jgi:RNA polymerase sigma-70 factor (ECF subfamily)